MKLTQKIHYAWIGQNATTGTPNYITGRLSKYGNVLAFSSRLLRDNYVDNFYNQNNPSEYAVKVNKKSGRAYNLGMSVFNYEEYLRNLELDEAVE